MLSVCQYGIINGSGKVFKVVVVKSMLGCIRITFSIFIHFLDGMVAYHYIPVRKTQRLQD